MRLLIDMEAETADDLASDLAEAIDYIRGGCTSGIGWKIVGEEEEGEDG